MPVWQDYDHGFHSQAAIDRALRWNVLLLNLQASTTMGQHTSGLLYCVVKYY